MKQEYTKKDYERVLRMELTESSLIEAKMQEAYHRIRTEGGNGYRRKGLRGLIISMSAVAAALVLSVTVCMSDPALAAKLPFIGNIFRVVGSDSGYAGDFEEHAVQLVQPDEVSEDGTAQSPWVQTDNGITFTVSECNYESMAMYLAVGIRSEEGFSKELQNFARYGSYDRTEEEEMYRKYSILYMNSTSTADFSASGRGVYKGNPAEGTDSPYCIEGKFMDDHTFAGIIRVDLMNMAILDEAEGWQKISNGDLPDNFTYTLHVTDLYADPEEGERLSGTWDFSLDVELNHSQTIRKEVNGVNEEGVGIGTVTRTAYELYAEPVIPEGKSEADYIVAVCDAEGRPLDSQAEYAEIYSIYGRDTSKVYVYVVEYQTYMESCKGNNYQNLPEKAAYQTEVVF